METWAILFAKIQTTIISADFWLNIGWVVFKIVLILVLANIAVRVGNVMIERVISSRAMRLDERRSKTLTNLLLNMSRYVVYFFVFLTILANLGLDITTLIAGAGVAGLAIGFGAQSFVKDVITGFFIIFEDQFGVGDNVMINTNLQIRGNVDEVGLRITKVRAYTGEMHIIPNSQILQVTNYSKTSSLSVIDVSVAFEEDLERVFAVLRRVGEESAGQVEHMTGELDVLGVQMIGPSEIVVRMTVECAPMEHFAVARELRKRIKEAFVEEGIEIPYPKQVHLFPKNQGVAFQKDQE